MQTTTAAAAERPPHRYVARLAGEADENEFLAEIGPAGVTWLRETGMATCPSPPPPASAHVAAVPTPAAAGGERPIPRHRVLRLAGEVDEDEVMDKLGLAGLAWLRANGLLTYPSPLLEELRDVFLAEVLPRLHPEARAVLAQVCRPWLAAVLASGLPRAGKSEGVPLRVVNFLGSVGRLWLGRGRTGARGTVGRVHFPLRAETWSCCSGRGRTDASGTNVYVSARPASGTWRF